MTKVITTAVLFALLLSGCDKKPSFRSYGECALQKKAEYIDAGANVLDGTYRAEAFCETVFPALEPRYESASPISIRLEKLDLCIKDCPEYRLWLSSSRDYITFKVTLLDGGERIFEKIRPTNIGNVVVFSPGGQVARVDVIETWLNINEGKHVGD